MYNSIELITKYSTKAWDKVYKAEAVSSLFDAPESQVQFTGAKTVKIAKFSATGLGNYYRNNDGDDRASFANPFGYAAGNVGLTWEEFTLKQDRSARYPVELFDNEETDGLALGAATTEISRTIMIPEVDAYCFSEVASYTSKELGNYVDETIGTKAEVEKGDKKTTPLAAINAALLYFDEHEVPAEKQIILASPRYMNALRQDDGGELNRYLLQADFGKDVKYTLTSYEGRKFAVVPPQRFRTKILKTADGRIAGNGVHWDMENGSKAIDFMVLATDAVLHVVKYNKVKIISGDMNLAGANFDGYSIFARIYHDVFVTDNKRFALYTHVGGFDVKVPGKLDVIVEDGKVARIIQFPGEVMAKYYTTEQEGLLDSEGNPDTSKLGTTFTIGSTDKLVKVGSAAETGDVVVALTDVATNAETKVKTGKILAIGKAR